MPEGVVRVVLLGCPGVGKRTLVREVMKHMADGDFADYDEPGVQQFAIINGQRTLLVCHDIYVEEEETEDPSAALLGNRRQGSSARFLRGGSKAPAKKVSGPKLRARESVFDKANNKAGIEKAKANAAKNIDDSEYLTAFVVVFDIGDVKSFQEAERQLNARAGSHVVLVGNKTDKARRYRRITYEEGLKISTQNSSAEVAYIEASAKLYQRVDQIFVAAVKKLQGTMLAPGGNTTAAAPGGTAGTTGGFFSGQSSGGSTTEDAGAQEASEAGPGVFAKCCASMCGGEDGAAGEGAPEPNCCAKHCKCCPRPVYSKLKKCGKCCACVIM